MLKKEYKYHSLSLPVYFIKQVKNHIKGRPEYKSVAFYAQEAMKEKMQRENSTVFRSVNLNEMAVRPTDKEIDKILQATQMYIDEEIKKLRKELKK